MLAQQGRGSSGLPRGSAKLDGRAGCAVLAYDGMVHLYEELPRLRMRMVNEAVDRQHWSDGDSDSLAPLHKLVALHGLGVLLKQSVDELPVFAADRPVHPDILREYGMLHNVPGQPGEVAVVIHGNVGVVAVGAEVGVDRSEGRVPALSAGDDVLVGVAVDVGVLRRYGCLLEGEIDVLALTGGPAGADGQQSAEGRLYAADLGRDLVGRHAWSRSVVAVGNHHARRGLGYEVAAAVAGVGAGLAEGRD